MSPDAPPPDLPFLSYVPALEGDFDDLADLRIAAMRESLEAVGRFDPKRARERLRSSFDPLHTTWVKYSGKRVGFFATRTQGGDYWIEHLYILPQFQSFGIGTAVLKKLIATASSLRTVLRVGALKGSRSNHFYIRHGFELESVGEWDNYYRRDT